MTVVVCGAGQVGSAIARYLSRVQNDINVIDTNSQIIRPRGDSVIEVGDRVVNFAVADAVKHVEKLFSVRLEFF